MKIREWLGRSKAAPGKEASTIEKALDPVVRAALVQETFESLSMVGFLKFRSEEQALGVRVTEGDRKEYFKFFEESFRPEYEAILAKGSDAQVREALDWWTKEANAKGLAEWQREQESNGREM